MKKIKKFFALLIAMAMVLGMSASVFAATITITQSPGDSGTAGNESYVAYKIFDVTKTADVEEDVTTDDSIGAGTEEGFAYSIDAESAWVSVVEGLKDADDKAYFTLTPSADGDIYTVKLSDDKYNTEAYAKEIAGKLLAAVPTLADVDQKYEFTTEDGAVTVDDGYYLITSSLGTNLVLATSNINITTKNEYIVDNKVAETASVTIGENATYYVKVYLPESIDVKKPVIVHDTLAEQLSFNDDSVQVAVLDADPGSTSAAYKAITTYGELPAAFVVGDGDEEENPCTFHITLDTEGYAGKYLVFKYTAELLSTADADGDGYVNKEFSTYSEYTTKPSEPVVKTYDFDFTKVDGDGAKLDGAEFELYADWDTEKNEAIGDPIDLLAVDAKTYKKADTDDETTVTTIVVDSLKNNAATKITGLGGADNENGTNYYLVETKEPAGFNKLSAPIIVNIKDDGTITVTYDGKTLASPNDAFNVENLSGTVLPSTGGIGTTIFYVVGAILVIGAGVVFVTRRRMNVQ